MLELRGIDKSFGSTRAVRGATLRVTPGSIHGVVGENGAGKSTLARVAAGVVRPDAGTVVLDGRERRWRSPADARHAGVAFVSQELALSPARSAIDNVFLGIEPTTGPFVLRRRLREAFDELVDRTGIAVAPDTAVERLGPADQQRVEILRALACDAHTIVVDEPTTRLDEEQARRLADTFDRLRTAGRTVLLISHDLDWMLSLCDVITVMRDGVVTDTVDVDGELCPDDLVLSMAGLPGGVVPPTTPAGPTDTPVVLNVEGLRPDRTAAAVSFTVRAGEILGIAGLVGSGRTKLARAVYGADRAVGGSMTLNGAAYAPRSPAEANRAGVVMVSESRRDGGILPGRSLRENVSLPWLRQLSQLGRIDRRVERDRVARSVSATGVACRSIEQRIETLSGGNQQRALFSRWESMSPTLYIVDEPTRGVDAVARSVIHQHLVDQAAAGSAVLVISSDLEELIGLAHRALVMRDGAVVADLSGAALAREPVLQAALGSGTG